MRIAVFNPLCYRLYLLTNFTDGEKQSTITVGDYVKISRSRTIAFLLATLSTFLLYSCGSKTEKESYLKQTETAKSMVPLPLSDSVIIELAGADSQTVFDLLRNGRQVEYRSSAMGVFVTAIDSIENGGGAYWLYSVNDSILPVACDKYVTKIGDIVKWHFRKTTR